MLIYNKDIMCINKDNLCIDNVFQALYNCVGKAVYVTEKKGKVEGIVSPVDFFHYYIEKTENEYNDLFSYIQYDDSEAVMRKKAKELFDTKGIRGAVPVINEDGIVEGEYIELEKYNCDQNIEKHKNKFDEYRTSFYSKKEVDALEKILCAQRIIIVGSENEFEKKIGYLFPDRTRVEFAKGNYYELLVAGEGLIIDVTDKYPLRREMYNKLGIGYIWDDFLNYLEIKVEENNVSRYEFLISENRCGDLIQYIKRTCSHVKYDYEQSIETTFVLRYMEYANVRIEYAKKNIYKDNISKIDFQRCNESIEKIHYSINVFIYFYLLENELNIINNSYDNIVLNYYLGKNIPLLDLEKKCFESVEYFNNNGHLPLFIAPIRKTFEGDAMEYADCFKEKITYENGLRKTLYQPEKYCGTIYCIGACTIYGAFVEDEYTIPTILQKELNNRKLPYRVINLGWLYDYALLSRIQRTRIEKDDIVVIFHHDYKSGCNISNKYYIDISERVEVMHDKVFFGNMYDHVNSAGSEAFAKSMLPELLESIDALEKNNVIKNNNVFDLYKMMPLEYKQKSIIDKTIHEMKSVSSKWSKEGRIGAIVMNANPFTNGHLFLVRQALSNVDYLYVFVVEEDESEFSFNDRFNMVRMGLLQYSDCVAVIPSGIIISNITFSDYFNSQKYYREEHISTIFDQIVFARYIARSGNISVRFVGTEDGDNTTAQYNRDMKRVLPYYGIEVKEIQRIKSGEDREIRAGDVRRAFRSGDFKKIRHIVPDTTYRYLLDKERSI